jgi:ribosomal protein S18 acetylase RimI-like enzyme
LKIQNSTIQDLESIFRLYRLGSEYQRSKCLENIWPEFDKLMALNEIKEQRQFKLIIDKDIACVWAITFEDPFIWEEKNIDPSIYIHRIATNPKFRGHNFVKRIVEWAKPFAIKNNKQFIRLDTCGNNAGLIKHYTDNGFTFLGIHKLKESKGLPQHYHNADVCFFEIDLNT